MNSFVQKKKKKNYVSDFLQKSLTVGRFIDSFLENFKDTYPKELNIEHHGTHETFLDLDIEIKDGIFVYKIIWHKICIFLWNSNVWNKTKKFFIHPTERVGKYYF